MFKEFRDFIARGNVIDLAVGVIMGAAFTSVVNSLVEDVIMPPIGYMLGGVNFNDLFLSLDGQTYESYAAAQMAGAPVIGYGAFINTLITFLLTALAVFFLVKTVNQLYRREAATAKPDPSVVLLTEIRDILKDQSLPH